MPKILLVDDSVELCNGLAKLIRDEGYLVDNVMDSRKAANLIQKKRYDLYILDYRMSGLNGIDLLKMIKSVNPQCPVFILSGLPSIEQLLIEKNVTGLVAEFIDKPFDIDDLLQKIESSIS